MHANESTSQSRTVTWTASILCSIALWTGCRTRVVVLSESEAVSKVEAGKPFTPRINGYYVPEARMREILIQLQEKVEARDAK
jgi:hypothetical protein